MKKHLQQKQIIVPPETATFHSINESAVHYGSCACPFCGESTIIGGPTKGKGLAFIHESCRHSQGIVAGGGFDITVLFRGMYEK